MSNQRAVSIVDAAELYDLDNKARGLAASSVKSYRAKMAVFVAWCDGRGLKDLAAISAIDLRRFLVALQDLELSNKYQVHLAKTVKTFLNYCVRDELIDKSPFDKVKVPKLENRILPALTTEQLEAVFAGCGNTRDLAICHILLDTGLRASELLALNVEDIDRERVVTVKQGKGKKDRVTYIGAKTEKILTSYLIDRARPPGTKPLITSLVSGDRLTLFGLAQMMERLRETSGVDICTCHAFRRTFALNCLRNGMNIYVLARIMGHVDITILKQYLDLLTDDLKAAHKQYGVVDNLQIKSPRTRHPVRR